MRIGFTGFGSLGDRCAAPPAHGGRIARRPDDSAGLPVIAPGFAAMPGQKVAPPGI